MPTFGTVSSERLATCHPALQKVMRHVVRTFDISILEGFRLHERQVELYESGKSKTMKSKHLHYLLGDERRVVPWSHAVDIAPYPIDFGLTPKEILKTFVDTKMDAQTIALLERRFIQASKVQARFYHMAGIVLATAEKLNIGLRWGGDWDMDTDFFDQTFDDLAHFELTGEALLDPNYDGSY